jgi:CheY-like chemotaxis protein
VAPSLQAQIYLVEVKLEEGLGYQVTRAIRKHPSLYRAQVLLTSNSSEPHDVEYGLHEGADAFVKKPFTAEDFASKLKAMLRLETLVEERCPLTGFGSLYGLRREVDHWVFREADFALCYIIPKGLSQFRQAHAQDRVNKAACEAARVIRDTVHNDGFYETYCCHLGSGHFMVRITVEDWKRFYKCVTGRFSAAHAQANGDAILPTPTLRFGAVLNDERHRYRCAQDLFRDLQGSPLSEGTDLVSDKSKRQAVRKKAPGHEHWAG